MKKIDICVGTDRSRIIRVRLSLLYLDDVTGDIVSEKYHSINIAPGDNPNAVKAAVDAHLAMPQSQSGIPGAPWPAIPDTEWQEVLDYVKVAHTPERIAEYRALQAENEKAAQ